MSNMLFAGSSARFKGFVTPIPSFVYKFELQSFSNLNIKKIISGGAYKYIYNCLWTVDNKIYLYPLNYNLPILLDNEIKYFTKINDDQYEIKQFILGNNEIKDIIGNAIGLFFWMKNGELFYLNFNTGIKQIETLQSKTITTFGTGIMSERYFFKDDRGKSYLFSENNLLDVTLDNEDPMLFGCGASSDTNVMISKTNKLFTGNTFKYVPSSFENESKVIDLQCGYKHSIILLENQSVYGFGFNSLYQCGVFEMKNMIYVPTKFTIPLKLPILSICCTSRGTCIVSKDEIVFIGEIVEIEKDKTKRISTSIKIDNNFELNYFNAVACGPWHYIVYKKSEKISKSLEYFISNLKKKNIQCSDITIIIS